MWFEAFVLGATTALASGALAGLAAALVGGYRFLVVLVVAVPTGVGVAAVVFRLRASSTVARSAHLAAVAAVVLAIGFAAWASWAPSHHVLINRDPGSYTTTARWLVRDGGLEASARLGGLDDDQLLRTHGFAVHDVGGGRLEFAFTHLTAIALAAAYDLAGPAAMFRFPAAATALGLLALFGVAARVTRHPWIALVAPALLCVCLPVLFVARDTYSEPVALVLAWSALLAGLMAAERDRAGIWAISGLLAGAALAARPDLILAFVALGPLLVLHFARPVCDGGRVGRLACATAFAAASAPGVALGMIDLFTASGRYAERHGSQVRLGLLAAIAATAVAPVVLRSARRVGIGSAPAFRRQLALAAGTAAVVVMLAAWLLRPELQTVTDASPSPLVAGLQAAAGVPVEPLRRYGELSVVWLSWYLGPSALVLGVLGFGLAVARTVRATADNALVVAVCLFGVVGAVTLWDPVITPDQVWAMRRFVPVVLPCLAIFVAMALSALRSADVGRVPTRRAAVAGLALVAVVGAGVTSWPVRSLREQHGYRAVLEEACRLMGDDASVIVLGRPEVDVLPQAVRSWCGVPTSAVAEGVSVADLGPVIRSVRSAGNTPVLVSGDASLLADPSADPSADANTGRSAVATTSSVADARRAERTLLRPPSRYADPGEPWSLSVRRLEP